MPERSSKSFYDKTYFDYYGGIGYTWETVYLTLKPFANSILNLTSLCTSLRLGFLIWAVQRVTLLKS
jgi:hypothetical protein